MENNNIFEIKRYTSIEKENWNDFLKLSKNGTFILNRNYMDYHSDRFNDFSIMIYRKKLLYALLPANLIDGVLYSHLGLTYGGFIMSSKVTTSDMLQVATITNEFLKANGIRQVIYKPIPYIYHSLPAQEDLYAIFKICDAKIIGRNISTSIFQDYKIEFTESRKSGIRKANKNGITVGISDNYTLFWDILNDNLNSKYNLSPTHSLDEILYLIKCFPENIKLYVAYKDNVIIGGTLIYISSRVIHTQYISANPLGKELGALDLIFDYLINNIYVNYPIFDFGHSTEHMGKVLNESLIFQKEGLGGRGITYDTYEYVIK